MLAPEFAWRSNCRPANPGLGLLVRFDYRATHVIAAFGAYRVSRHDRAALRAVPGLLLFDVMVRTAFAGSRV
jgi:hypothetical protein